MLRPDRVAIAKHVPVANADGSRQRAPELDGRGHQRIENRLQVEGGTTDDLQHLSGRGLLLQRFVEVVCARVDIGFEGFVALLDSARHLVEAVGERLDLVARVNVEALCKIAGPEFFGALLQAADRHDHPPRQESAGGERQQQAKAEQGQGLEQGRGDGSQRLGERLLHEDDPVRVWRDRVSGQDLSPVESGRDLGRADAGTRGHCGAGLRAGVGVERLPHLGKPRKIRIAQNEAQVRMGDQPALAVDDEGVALAADADSADDVPDELQVHVGDGHAGVLAYMGERDRHIGLGAAPEFDRTEPDLVGHGLREAGVS